MFSKGRDKAPLELDGALGTPPSLPRERALGSSPLLCQPYKSSCSNSVGLQKINKKMTIQEKQFVKFRKKNKHRRYEKKVEKKLGNTD